MESSNQTAGEPDYPVRFSVEYPDRDLNRLTTAFRLIVAIPIVIVAGSIGGHEGSFASGEHGWKIAGGTGGLLSDFQFHRPQVSFQLRTRKHPGGEVAVRALGAAKRDRNVKSC